MNFEKLCNKLNLGVMIKPPRLVFGGYLHRMFELETTCKKYAVKVLNPEIMLRPMAIKNTVESELVADFLKDKIPVVAAIRFNDQCIIEFDGQHYMLFEWNNGRCLKRNEITISHCRKIGDILAKIHMTDLSKLRINDYSPSPLSLPDWDIYLKSGKKSLSSWTDLLEKNIDYLTLFNRKIMDSYGSLIQLTVISHGDLDPKNVMWENDEPFVIDWESTGYIHPMADLLDTAVYWAEDGEGIIAKDKFLAFIDEYRKYAKLILMNWEDALLYNMMNKFGWLEYNLKRSLMIECADIKEQQSGTEQVIRTIGDIRHYGENIPLLVSWLNELD